ncbi:MAG: hypothetical protein FVQ77_09055 [Cytophagales bacterium]|nr:hypothetical protein [Cytophagales bacterium]
MEPIITFVTLVAGVVTIIWFIRDVRRQNSKELKNQSELLKIHSELLKNQTEILFKIQKSLEVQTKILAKIEAK